VSRSNLLPLAMVLCAVTSADHASAAAPKVGERHADFTLPNIADGKPVSLSDFRGKKVLLIQFASW
jgi:peroxiredoxin